jgi:type II secretory pathway component PulF
MKNDEFAFFNQQLAAMLRDGIPLEGALRRLCADMRHGTLRSELEKLEADLAQGTPLDQALRTRQLPELYQRMLEVGVKSNDLPGVLTLLADHYERGQAIRTRLKGLMVYPAIVLAAAFLLACFLSFLTHIFIATALGGLGIQVYGWAFFPLRFGYLIIPTVLGVLVLAVLVAATSPTVRRGLRWWAPAFHEASLAQIASALALMLKSGLPLKNALALIIQLERGTPAEIELARWMQNLAAGRGKFTDMAAGGRMFPPLFVWMVSQSGEDLAAGFQRASETYLARANYRSELLLYSALPCAILGLGLMIVLQVQPVISVFASFMQALGEM